jgi:signal transduction histidine kinase
MIIPFTFSQVYEGIKSATRAISARVFRLLKPVSINEDRRRREYILHIILFISICLLLVLEATIIKNYFTFERSVYDGLDPVNFGMIIFLYIMLFALSKKGYSLFVSYALIAVYSAGTLYSGWTWGISLPATLLATALVILTSSILIGSTFGFVKTCFMVLSLIFLGIHERTVLGVPPWHLKLLSITDIVSYSSLFLFMSFIAWLSNREISHSLSRARTSEKLLEMERNALEKRISERAEELVRIKTAGIENLERAAQFGKLSQGLLHDLITSLSTISIYTQRITTLDGGHPGKRAETVEKLLVTSRKMSSFMQNLKQCTGHERIFQTHEPTDIVQELNIIKDLLSYKARMACVKLRFDTPDSIITKINRLRIHQVLLNLISNAIEACENSDSSGEQSVAVSISQQQSSILLSVSDTGCGISSDNLKKVFKYPFTTKTNGTGNGLTTTFQIIENELGGKITVNSSPNQGTVFTVRIPIPTSPSLPSPHDSLGTTASAMTSDTAEHP